ncbi:MAG: D-2-hydroxyacid dehydrogenase [Planctomycetes bacterium]|nr:D-2-hydroxyacid dehydrogenase [Planctomycetota bacterium]
MKKTVVLDGYTLNPGDLSWDGFEKLAPIEVYDRTEPERIVERARGAEFVLTNKTPLSAETLALLPELRYIGVLATGYNVVDVQAARGRGIPVCNIPTYGTSSVAQHTFALILELTLNVRMHSDAARAGEWSSCRDWCFWKSPLFELDGKTLGIVGFGRIGRRVAEVGNAFGMRILAQDSVQVNPPPYDRFRFAELDELLSESDVVSLHCPLFPETKGLMNTARLRRMKRTAFLINTSRGPLIVDQDLADALNSGVIGGAAVDVLSVEPPAADNPLLTARNCLVTPHIAWAAKEARARLMDLAVENLAAFLNGRPQNVVNPSP